MIEISSFRRYLSPWCSTFATASTLEVRTVGTSTGDFPDEGSARISDPLAMGVSLESRKSRNHFEAKFEHLFLVESVSEIEERCVKLSLDFL